MSSKKRREDNETILCKRVIVCSSFSFYAENNIVLLHEHSVRYPIVPLQQKTEHGALLVIIRYEIWRTLFVVSLS